MKWMFAAVFAAAIASASAPGVEAKGCIKGAIVGGAAGHMAGHGKLGAAWRPTAPGRSGRCLTVLELASADIVLFFRSMFPV